jgi:hypothetical protein
MRAGMENFEYVEDTVMCEASTKKLRNIMAIVCDM